MFESGIERTVVGTAIVLWFAHGWYLNERLRGVHKKLDLLCENFDGLREYLYEKDSQFDDERESDRGVHEGNSPFTGMSDIELLKRKRAEGRRTLNTPFAQR